MSSKSRQKQQGTKSTSPSDEIKYRRKYKELKKKIHEMEEENDKINLRLVRARKSIQRLKIERSFLVDRLEQSQQQINNESESELSSSPPRAMESDDELSSSQEELLEDSRVGKRKKQVRDPNAPKRPRNAFLIYCQNQREQAREENQNNKGFQGVTRFLSQKWKDLPEDERKIYFEMYNKEKLRYKKEMSSYVGASIGSEDLQRDQNESMMMIEDINNANNDNVASNNVDYDDQATPTTEKQPISSNNIHNHYNHQEEKYPNRVDAESEDNDRKDRVMMIKDEYGEDSSVSEEMFDELAGDISYNRGFTRDDMLHYDENEGAARNLEAEDDDDDDDDDDEEEEAGSVEGGGDLDEYDRHDTQDTNNTMSENDDQ